MSANWPLLSWGCGIDASCRLSFYLYKMVDEVEHAVDALAAIVSARRGKVPIAGQHVAAQGVSRRRHVLNLRLKASVQAINSTRPRIPVPTRVSGWSKRHPMRVKIVGGGRFRHRLPVLDNLKIALREASTVWLWVEVPVKVSVTAVPALFPVGVNGDACGSGWFAATFPCHPAGRRTRGCRFVVVAS